MQVEFVRGAGGNIVFIIAHQRLQTFYLRDFCHVQCFATGVGTHPGRGENAGLMGDGAGGITGMFQRMPDRLQKQALLRGHRLRFLSRIAKQGGVEAVGVV